MLRAYIESNLAFMREHRNYMVAVVEILRNGAFTTDSGRRVDGQDVDVAAHLLKEQLARLGPKGNCEVTSTQVSWRWRSGPPSMWCHTGSSVTLVSTSTAIRARSSPSSTWQPVPRTRHDRRAGRDGLIARHLDSSRLGTATLNWPTG
jgi:hypothetical protein